MSETHHTADAAAAGRSRRADRRGRCRRADRRVRRQAPSPARPWRSSAAAWPGSPRRTSSPSAASGHRLRAQGAGRQGAQHPACPAPPPAAARALPGEHGFRFFPGFYHHVPDSMRRIPVPRATRTASGTTSSTPASGKSLRAGRPRRTARSFGIGPDPQRGAHRRTGCSRILIEELVKQQGVPPHEARATSSSALMVFLTSCDERRYGQWEHVSWWDFVGAEGKSDGVPEGDRARAHAHARRRQGDGRQHPHDRQHGRGVRHEHHAAAATTARSTACSTRRPTRPGSTRGSRTCASSACASASARRSRRCDVARRPDRRRHASATAAAGAARVEADWFVCAMPAERARTLLVAAACSALDPSLERMRRAVRRLDGRASSSTCARQVDITHGHVTFVDAPWALTALTQAQFWAERDFAARLRRRQRRSTACRSTSPTGTRRGSSTASRPSVHARARSQREVWAQIKAHLEDSGERVLPDDILHSWFLDPGDPVDPTSGGATATTTPLLVNTVGSWEKRPEGAHQDPEPVPRRRLRADRHRPGDDGGRERVRPRRGQRAARRRRARRPSRATMYKLYDPPEFEAAKARRPRALQGRASRTRSTSAVSAAERVDAVVVGARCAGSAAATALARAGRRVVALDRARFPSDTLSTHLLFAGGVAELAARSARSSGCEALGAPRLPRGARRRRRRHASAAGYTPVDGIDYALCVRRPGLDAALVETAREAGAEVREGVRVTELVWDGRPRGRRALRDGDGDERELRAPLVVGADGRRVDGRARGRAPNARTGSNANGRACFFAYWRGRPARVARRSPRSGARAASSAPRSPATAGCCSSCCMPPVDARRRLPRRPRRRVRRARSRAIPGLAGAAATAARAGDEGPRAPPTSTSYFRRSSGPGWALPGDAGHFKDPVTAQGIRDALRFGRLLGEAVAPGARRPGARSTARCARWERRPRPRVPRGLPVDQPARRAARR